MSPLRGFFGCVSPTHYHRQTHESRRPSPPDHSPLPHLRRRGLFSTYPLHNRVLRVTSPTLHSGSGALFGNDFLANLPQDLCELLRDCLRMLGLANALRSGPEGGLVQGWPLTCIFRPRRVAVNKSREWHPFGLERSPCPAYFSLAMRYNLSHRAAYVDRASA